MLLTSCQGEPPLSLISTMCSKWWGQGVIWFLAMSHEMVFWYMTDDDIDLSQISFFMGVVNSLLY